LKEHRQDLSVHCLYPHSSSALLFLLILCSLPFHPTKAKRMGYSGSHPGHPLKSLHHFHPWQVYLSTSYRPWRYSTEQNGPEPLPSGT
jgi:hypothetical protein